MSKSLVDRNVNRSQPGAGNGVLHDDPRLVVKTASIDSLIFRLLKNCSALGLFERKRKHDASGTVVRVCDCTPIDAITLMDELRDHCHIDHGMSERKFLQPNRALPLAVSRSLIIVAFDRETCQ